MSVAGGRGTVAVCGELPLGLVDRVAGAQRRHLRLLRWHGTAVTYDAVLTGFLICGHLWADQPGERPGPWQRRTRRAQVLIPPGSEPARFSASRIFAAAYPEALGLACLIASPAWRNLADGDTRSRSSSWPRSGSGSTSPATSPPTSATRSRTG